MSNYIACLKSAGSVRSICHRFYQLSFVAFSLNLLVSKCTSLRRLDRSQGPHWVCLLCPHCHSAGLWQNNIGMMQFKRKFLCRMSTRFSFSLGGLFGKTPKMSSPWGRLGAAARGFPVLHRSQADSVVFAPSTISCPPAVGIRRLVSAVKWGLRKLQTLVAFVLAACSDDGAC